MYVHEQEFVFSHIPKKYYYSLELLRFFEVKSGKNEIIIPRQRHETILNVILQEFEYHIFVKKSNKKMKRLEIIIFFLKIHVRYAYITVSPRTIVWHGHRV